VPAAVQKEVNARQADMAAGKLPVFAAAKDQPVRDNAGKVVIASGQRLTDAQILEMNWLAEGVQGSLTR
jgi:basic membrane protein A